MQNQTSIHNYYYYRKYLNNLYKNEQNIYHITQDHNPPIWCKIAAGNFIGHLIFIKYVYVAVGAGIHSSYKQTTDSHITYNLNMMSTSYLNYANPLAWRVLNQVKLRCSDVGGNWI